jgi:hypothetical protein
MELEDCPNQGGDSYGHIVQKSHFATKVDKTSQSQCTQHNTTVNHNSRLF